MFSIQDESMGPSNMSHFLSLEGNEVN
uniref:Uncharacterized protein n=1 Tax=Lepeophtheirus salmonis TaxID=72036 RepID=A0A0K2T0G7_LEPSM